MKNSCFIFFFLSLTVNLVVAQPTQADIDKMMKQANDQMKKYGKDSNVKNAMKGIEDQQKQVMDAMKNQPRNNNAATNTSLYDPGSYGNVDNWKFPAKNVALLSSLPKKTLTKSELVSFLNDIYTQLSQKMDAGIKTSVQAMVAKYKNDARKMGDDAVAGWYTDHKEEALLLITKAASTDPNNLLLLNNCAAFLNMGGIEQKAIPILKYVLQQQPGSSMALNNLGQAFAGLGATDSAMVYFGRCIQIVPEHPEACNTVAHIEASRGNIEKAIEYFEKSLKSAYSKPAELKLRKIKKGSKIVGLVRPRVKIPEYFNQFKYELPLQCTNTGNAILAAAEHVAFRKMISDQANVFGKKLGELEQKKYTEGMQIMKAGGTGRILKKGEFMAQPFYELCGIMHRDITAEFGKALADLVSRVDKKYFKEMEELKKQHKALEQVLAKGFAERADRCCGEGKTTSCCPSDEEKCTAYNNLANQFLPKFALLTEEWQKQNKLVFNTYFDEIIYWGYLTYKPTGVDNYNLSIFYPMATQYLVMLGKIANTVIMKPCEFKTAHTTKESNAIKEMDCPLDFDISFVVGNIELNCEKFAFKGGEGLLFKYEKNFKTRQSTLGIGIGLQLELGIVGAGVEQYAFVKFDGDGRCADAGIKLDVGAEAAQGIGVKGEVGYTLGIESGWDFNEGPFKNYLAPAKPVQINKNVKLYD